MFACPFASINNISSILIFISGFLHKPLIKAISFCPSAIIDRIAHHSAVITIKGSSYRTRELKLEGVVKKQ